MQAIRSTNTSIEILLRRNLFKRGYRYRVNYSRVVGKPDIVFVSAKVAVFCDSEFWHGKDWNSAKNKIKSNHSYWLPKIESNIQRDKKINRSLRQNGWKVIRFWGMDIAKNPDKCADRVVKFLQAN